MKKKSIVFFCIAFLILSIVPVINICSGNRSLSIKKLYSIDFIIPYVSEVLYAYGINVFSHQVVIGKNEWLFLGDSYSNTLTLTRNGVDAAYAESVAKKNISLQGWGSFFSEQGVRLFKVLVGPNKSSVYSEFLPGWVVRAEKNKIDILLENDNNKYFVYPRGALLLAKEKYVDHNLYYKADTHWNNLGGWIGFDHFIKSLKEQDLDINYSQSIRLEGDAVINGDDLASFLRLLGKIKDKQPDLEVLPRVERNTVCEKFYTHEYYECDSPEIISQPEPLLVVTAGAENTKKVLWLRDSFGTAVSPYMARLFSHVVQVHYDNITKESLIEIVKDFKPDYVFMTIVERDIDRGLPAEYPQRYTYPGRFLAHNDIVNKGKDFSIVGSDPYLVYKLGSAVQGNQNDFITMTLSCNSKEFENEVIDLQVFWKESADDVFTELNSHKFSVAQGDIELRFGSVMKWAAAKDIEYLRLDIEPASIDQCIDFSLNDFALNKF